MSEYSRWSREKKYRRKKALEEFNKTLKDRKGAFGQKRKLEDFFVKLVGKLGESFGVPSEITEPTTRAVIGSSKPNLMPKDRGFLLSKDVEQIESVKEAEVDETFEDMGDLWKSRKAKKWAISRNETYDNEKELMKALEEDRKRRYGTSFFDALKEDLGFKTK